jgi:hypothetical protein
MVGVYFHPASGKWQAKVSVKSGRKAQKHVGLYDTESEAMIALKAFLKGFQFAGEVLVGSIKRKEGKSNGRS